MPTDSDKLLEPPSKTTIPALGPLARGEKRDFRYLSAYAHRPVHAASGRNPIVDSTWESASGEIYYVEAKFGTSGLTAAQRLAANAFGDQYQVAMGYEFFQRLGGTADSGMERLGRCPVAAADAISD